MKALPQAKKDRVLTAANLRIRTRSCLSHTDRAYKWLTGYFTASPLAKRTASSAILRFSSRADSWEYQAHVGTAQEVVKPEKGCPHFHGFL